MMAGLAVIHGKLRPRPVLCIRFGSSRVVAGQMHAFLKRHERPHERAREFARALGLIAGLGRLLLNLRRLLPDPLPVPSHARAEGFHLEGRQGRMARGIHLVRDDAVGGNLAQMA